MRGSLRLGIAKGSLLRAFPQLAIKHIELDHSGWDNVVAVVNHEIIFRFPRRPEVACTLEVESRLLPELCKVVSLPIPNFEFIARGCKAFHGIFVGYRLIPGEPLTRALFRQIYSAELTQHLARQLAKFLSEMHSFPVKQAVQLGVPHTPDRDLWAGFYAEVRKHVFPLLEAHERAWAQKLFESFLDDKRNFQFKPVLLHGDFSPDHILFDRKTGRITGIIDFGDTRIGDPAYDFQWREDYGEHFWQALLNHYKQSLLLADARNKLKIDEAFFRRLEFYEQRLPLGEILYGITCNAPEYITSGLQALRRAVTKEEAQDHERESKSQRSS